MARSNVAAVVTDPEAREHPLLFNADMVRAILSGQKTMTRRAISVVNSLVNGDSPGKRSNGVWGWPDLDFSKAWVDRGPSPAGNPGPYLKVPGGDESVQRVYSRIQTGDRLWVRETWGDAGVFYGKENNPPQDIVYRADGAARSFSFAPDGVEPKPFAPMRADRAQWNLDAVKWRPSIFMPRWASRITLEVTAVRPERVQEISEEDAKAEGAALPTCSYVGRCNSNRCSPHSSTPYRNSFESLWQSINGKRPGCSWQNNQWCWVIGFKVVK